MRRPSYAAVTSTLALVVALGGTSYAVTALPAASVGTAQLKNGAVTTAKLHPHSVGASAVALNSLTGAQINESKLGTVPHAATADSAGTATNAQLAGIANNANALGGKGPSAYELGCPADMVMTKDLCVELNKRDTAVWETAESTCALASRRLPAAGEMAEALNALGANQSYEWTSSVYVDAGNALEAILLKDDASRALNISTSNITTTLPYRCVSTPIQTG